MKHFILSFVCGVLAMLSFPLPAANVSLAPVKVELSSFNKISTLTVFNRGNETVTFEVSASIWNQSQDGQWIFAPTSDVKVYPRVITIPPQQSSVVRVGYVGASSETLEKSYRLFLKELFDPRQRKENTITIVTNINLPVFYQDAISSHSGKSVSSEGFSASFAPPMMSFSLQNNTSVHIAPQSASYEWFFKGKKVHHQEDKMDAYVLPGKKGVWGLKVPFACNQVDEVRMKVNEVSYISPVSCAP